MPGSYTECFASLFEPASVECGERQPGVERASQQARLVGGAATLKERTSI